MNTVMLIAMAHKRNLQMKDNTFSSISMIKLCFGNGLFHL